MTQADAERLVYRDIIHRTVDDVSPTATYYVAGAYTYGLWLTSEDGSTAAYSYKSLFWERCTMSEESACPV